MKRHSFPQHVLVKASHQLPSALTNAEMSEKDFSTQQPREIPPNWSGVNFGTCWFLCRSAGLWTHTSV